MLRKIYFFATFVASLVFISSCQEDDAPNYPAFPIEAKASLYLEGPEISWTALKSSDLTGYRIWRSIGVDTVPDNPAGKAFLIGTISDPDILTLVDFNFNNSTSLNNVFYRVEGVLKNRSVWSKNVNLKNSSIELKSTVDAVAYDKNSNLIFLADRFNNTLYKFDAQKEAIVGSLTIPNSSVAAMQLSVGKKGSKTEVYLGQDTKLRIYDAETFKQTDLITLDKNILGISNDNEGRVFISTSDQLKMIDTNNGNKETTYDAITLGTTVFRHFYIPGDNTLLKVESGSPFLCSILKLDATHTNVTGVEIEQKLKGVTTSLNDFSKVAILDANKFIISNKGYVVDRTLTNIAKLNSSFNSSTTTVFRDIQINNKQNIIGSLGTSSISNNSIITWQYPNTVLDENTLSSSLSVLFLMPMKENTWAVVNNLNFGKVALAKIKN